MKGDALIILSIIGLISIACIVAYYIIKSEEVKIEYPYIPSIPKYSDITFSPISSKPGKLPTEYLDLTKEYFEFPYSLKSSFLDPAIVVLCPYLSYTTQSGETKTLNEECKEIKINPNEEKTGYITIKLENKEEIKDSTKVFVVINVTYSSNLRGLCDLYINEGYPSCSVTKNSEIKITPLLAPNPIKLGRDEYFSIDLEVEKYGESLTLSKIEFQPLETKVIRKLRDKNIEEKITIEGKCELKKEITIGKKEFLRICTLPKPKFEIREESAKNITFYYLPFDCQKEEARKLKICEIVEKEKREDILKKIPIFLNISFFASKSYSYRLYPTN